MKMVTDFFNELLSAPAELLTVIVCLLLGYWLVSIIMGRKDLKDDNARRQQSHEQAEREYAQHKAREEQGRAEQARQEQTERDQAHKEQESADRRQQEAEDEARRSRRPEAEKSRHWHEVLGVSATATMVEIKQAYRIRISEYHPDKVASLGRELRELAEAKSREINEAYRIASLLRK